ncbi:MAG: hypothetical protein AAFY22_02205, partial [Pseudomonadota bacterium]
MKQRSIFISVCTSVMSFLMTSLAQADTPPTGTTNPLAFPTAEGFGKYAVGGRGGAVYVVSNLNDAGPGSLRECAEASGPRTCVFSVSGEIQTQSTIRITEPYITIAGQSAPGDGIQLTNRGTGNLERPLLIDTHDVIIRFIASRPGPPSAQTSNVDALTVSGQDIILDHLSLAWSNDEVLNIFGNRGILASAGSENTANITVQWSLIYEPLENAQHPSGAHSFGVLIDDGARDVTFHHNLIANSFRRNPNTSGIGQLDYVNNVTFNWARYAGEVYNRRGSTFLNWVNNIAIAGPNTIRERRWVLNAFNNNDLADFAIHADGNIDYNRTAETLPGDISVDPKDHQFLSTTPVGYGISLASTSITDAQQAYRDVLAFAGMGAFRPQRDSSDQRVITGVQGCQGDIIDDPIEVGGWPTLQSTTAPVDADADGMADDWEVAEGFDPTDPNDRNGDQDADGYTNLEEYLNELAGDNLGPR